MSAQDSNAGASPRSTPRQSKQQAAQERCGAMLRAVRAQITAGSVNGVNLNEVLRVSGGSKATLVKYFGDRAGLIAAAIEEEAREAMAALRRTMDQAVQDDAGARAPDAAITAILAGLLRFYISDASLGVYRTVIATGGVSGRIFYEKGHQTVVAELADMLCVFVGDGLRADLDVRHAAERLTHAIRAGCYERALLGLAQTPISDEEILREAAATCAFFLDGARRPDG
ncbi:TetR/AcrR family transcriptional regulator C-terminal domain-containing protein [Novosphingobium sp. KACC 22771]|uniref:TetR/AcrR family transcriptional regulator C-terminal domain-containing protein n=1 Tax=Novosphingobium sp. KACC 22771 TaxID=3025670 RepID=UPI0023657181|nr:TetR/AcrR family transcriptional regulator C-terminal domain-containing protein [Novosphingobium sp. KACC 22771]WDF71751.1 TetR/AcrR family transcriptional regulator C-terminal domain-containing protein [Novosphingobium sp. KACC 22771]